MSIPRWRISLYAMVALYIGAGFNHFLNPDFYLSVMPEWLPYHELSNWAGGVVEIILGILLLPPATRLLAARTIVLMLTVFFFVIHIPMCFHFETGSVMFSIAVFRIPLQAILIWWAWKFARGENVSRKNLN